MCVSVGYKAAANLKYIHEENLPKRCYDELSRHWHPEWNSPFQVPHDEITRHGFLLTL